MFENIDRQTTEAEVIGILIAHLGAFGSAELINFYHSFHKLLKNIA